MLTGNYFRSGALSLDGVRAEYGRGAEDETVVRIAAVEILMDAGFQLVEAKHAEEALSALRSRYRTIHLLFTEINMAGLMSGLELAHHARAEWPHIALLITSGDDEPLPDKLPAGSVFWRSPMVLPRRWRTCTRCSRSK